MIWGKTYLYITGMFASYIKNSAIADTVKNAGFMNV